MPLETDELYAYLRGYLANSPTKWTRFADALSIQVAPWALESIEQNSFVDPHPRWESAKPEEFGDVLIERFLSAERCRSLLEKVEAFYQQRTQRTNGTLAVLASELQQFLLVSLNRSPREVAEYVEGVFSQGELMTMAANALESVWSRPLPAPLLAQTQVTAASVQLLRLEVIDLDLYRSIQANPELLRTIEWRVFERLLADMLERFGFEVELQRGTRDGGVGIFAVKRIGVFGPERFLIQAKRWKNKVGVEPVQQLVFLQSHLHVTKSCLATTATFTKGALQLGKQYAWQLELRDFDGLKTWVDQVVQANKQKHH